MLIPSIDLMNGQIVQLLQASSGQIKAGTVYWNSPTRGPLIYLWAENDFLKAFHFNGATIDSIPVAQGTVRSNGSPGGVLAISANGSTAGSGILWSSIPISANADHGVVSGVLRAYDAANPGGPELWDSQQNPARDSIGNFAKFVQPTVANGRVYMATFSNSLLVYGELPTAAQNDVAVLIARRTDDAGDPILVDAKKTVRRSRRGHRVDGDLQAAIGRVFESDGHRQAAGAGHVEAQYGIFIILAQIQNITGMRTVFHSIIRPVFFMFSTTLISMKRRLAMQADQRRHGVILSKTITQSGECVALMTEESARQFMTLSVATGAI